MDTMKSLKTTVLKVEMAFICEELGDPARYIPSLRGKNLLDQKDTDLIRSQTTSFHKTQHLVEILLNRQGQNSEHPLDILINELKKQRVQVHIARRLQRTLKKMLKKSESETSEPNGVSGAGGEQPLPLVSTAYQRQQSQSSATMDPPSPPSVVSVQYEIDPNVGQIPHHPPPLSTSYPRPSDNHHVDPEHGACPGTPPQPTSQQSLADGSLAPSTHPPHYTPTQGMQYVSLNDPRYNGDNEIGGQSMHDYPSSLETDTSYPSYATNSLPDMEKEKLHATIDHLNRLLVEEQNKNEQLTRDLVKTKQELVFARQELAANRSKPMDTRQESVVRPGTLFPMPYMDQQQHQHCFRQASPAARVEARYSMSSQGDNLSMRSANSTTSVNSSSSAGNNNASRTHLQSFV